MYMYWYMYIEYMYLLVLEILIYLVTIIFLFRWTQVSSMLTARMNLGVGAIKDMRDEVTGATFSAIYAIGGYSGKSILGTAEKYDIQTDTWIEISPMKTPRRNVGKAAIV